MSFKGGPVVRCMYDYDSEEKIWSCHRPSLPGRLLCHKHAGMKKKEWARRAKKKRTK